MYLIESAKMMSVVQKLVDGEPAAFKTLTNNQDRIIFALQWHIDNGLNHLQSREVEGKNSAKATAYIDAGNIAFSRSLCKDSIEAYCNAVMHAIPGSKELARAYANRSAVTCEMAMYGDSLKDIDRALAIGYPNNLKAKLYVRQAKCLWAVNGKMCPGIKASIETAEKWIKKMDECNRKKWQTALDDMKTPDFLKTLNLVKTCPMDGGFMPEPPADNPKILQASRSIELRYSDEFGRHLAATRDINAGEVLFVDNKVSTYLPVFKEEDRKFVVDVCWNCAKICSSGVSCTQCVHVIYCDEKCRDEDWENYHEIDCPVISTLLIVAPTSAQSQLYALRMTIKAMKEAGSFQALKDKLEKIDSIADPLEKFLENNVLNSSTYTSYYSLVTDNTPCFFHHALCATTVVSQLCQVTKIFGGKMTKTSDIIQHKWARFVGSLILRNLQIIHAFSYVTIDQSSNCSSFMSYFTQPLVALCNHSCDANASMYFHRNKLAVFALQKIASGQQICLSYTNLSFCEASKDVRRELLLERYKFLCTCTACTNDWTVSDLKSFHNVPLSIETTRVLNVQAKMLLKLKRLVMTSPETSVAEQITLLQNILNTFDPIVQISCAEFYRFKFVLNNLYRKVSLV